VKSRIQLVILLGMLIALTGCARLAGPCPLWEHTDEWEEWVVLATWAGYANTLLEVNAKFEISGDPRYSTMAGAAYAGGGGNFRSKDARNAVALRLIKKASLCGDMNAVKALSNVYREGRLGVPANPERAQCLKDYMDSGGEFAACRIRLDELNDFPSEALLSPTTIDPNDPCDVHDSGRPRGQCDDR
jgi:hypothetical protein